MSSEDLVVIHPCLSIILPQAPKDDLKVLVRMTADKSQWNDFFYLREQSLVCVSAESVLKQLFERL